MSPEEELMALRRIAELAQIVIDLVSIKPTGWSNHARNQPRDKAIADLAVELSKLDHLKNGDE